MKKTNIILLFIMASALTVMLVAALQNDSEEEQQLSGEAKVFSRIISLAPNATEILFELGLGEKVIGVSEFCKYPPQVQGLPEFGGLLNPDLEAIASAEPDLIIILEEMASIADKCVSLGIETLAVKHNSIEDIFSAIEKIGSVCRAEQRAIELIGQLKEKVHRIEVKRRPPNRPKVMVCVDHGRGGSEKDVPANIYIAGRDGFYDFMLEAAGGENIYKGQVPFPSLNYESVVSANPDIVIDIIPPQTSRQEIETIKKQWHNFRSLNAVQNGKVFIVSDEFMSVPGPRFILILEKIAAIVEPNEQQNN